MTPAALLLIDSQALFLDGLAIALRGVWPDVRLSFASDFVEASPALGEEHVNGVLANWETLSGGQLEQLVDLAAPAPVILTAQSTDEGAVAAALSAGARGFLPKTMGGDAIRSAVVVALSGGVCFPNQALEQIGHAQQRSSIRFQGQRQIEVLGLLERGLSNKAIARELGLSAATVKLHVHSLLRSTGARSRFEAVYNARRMGLLPPSR